MLIRAHQLHFHGEPTGPGPDAQRVAAGGGRRRRAGEYQKLGDAQIPERVERKHLHLSTHRHPVLNNHYTFFFSFFHR